MSGTVRRQPKVDDPVERRVLEAVDRTRIVALLDRLVRVPSLGGAERPAQEVMAAAMAEAGMCLDRWEIDLAELRRHAAFSEEIERREALGLVGTVGQGDGPHLAFNGHVDVVDAGVTEDWSVPPWQTTLRDGEVLGRGTLDMKGSLAAAVEAVRALGGAGVQLAGSLSLHSVVGEEDGGTGTLATLLRGHRADAAVVMEPTELAIAPAQAGALNFRIRVRGRSTHACVRTEGDSAIDRLAPLLVALRALEARRNERLRRPLFDHLEVPFALSVGTVRGGEWPATVPEQAEISGRYGIAPGESLAAARGELEAAVAAACGDEAWRRRPPQVEWWGGAFAPAAIPTDAPIVRALAGAGRDVRGGEPPLRAMPYGSDMRLLCEVGGIPTVMYGPGNVRRAHAADEGVAVADLEALAGVLALLAVRFCGVASVRA